MPVLLGTCVALAILATREPLPTRLFLPIVEPELAIGETLVVGAGPLLMQARSGPLPLRGGLRHSRLVLSLLGHLGAAFGHLTVLPGLLLPAPGQLALVAPLLEPIPSEYQRGQRQYDDNYRDHYSYDRCG